jgi:dienelactone hydrolase
MPTSPRPLFLSIACAWLAACGGGGGGSASTGGGGTAGGGTPTPTVSISASPTPINSGGSATLTWSSTNATSCTASGAWSGARATAGSEAATPSATANYALACTGGGGTASASATVTVSTVPAPTVTISASPTTVASGSGSTITWVTTNATSCSASGSWTGTQATSGSYGTGALVAGAGYTLTCTGAGGTSAAQTAWVTLQDPGAPTAASASALGPLAVRSYASGIVIPGTARFQEPTIWYPGGGSGNYPGVVFVPGHNGDYLNPALPLDQNDATQWARLLASHGFVVMFVNSKNIPNDGPNEKMYALLDAVEALATESARSGSPIAGLLDPTRIAVMGHSLGGSAALFTANGNGGSNARIKAVLALSPVPDSARLSAFGPYPDISVPAMILAGVGDPFYTAASFQGEYNTIPSTTSKALAIFTSTSEFATGSGSMHNIALVPLGAHTTDPLVARLGLSFLEYYLAGDAQYQQFLVTDPALQSFLHNP